MFCITAKTENEGLQNRTNLLHPTLIKRKLIVASLRISQAAANGSPGYHKERESERERLRALFSNHFQPGWQQPAKLVSLAPHRRLLAAGGALNPSSPLPPTLPSLPPPPLTAQRCFVVWSPVPEPSEGFPPSAGLADISWGSPRKPLPKAPGPLGLAPPPPRPPSPAQRGKEGRRGSGLPG